MRFTRKRALRVVAAAGAIAVAGTAAGCDWPEGTRYVHQVFNEVEVTEGIVYRSTTTHEGEPIDLRLDIYEPVGDTAEQRPVVFWMFGGGWQSGNRDQLAAFAEDSARRGYVGVTIDYRIRPDGDDLLAAAWDAYDDSVAAAEWLADNAADWDIDPDAIIAAGYSAGAINAAHLLFAPGTRGPDEPPVAGAVSISGMTFVAPSPDRPPLIAHHGTDDGIVAYAWGQDMCEATEEGGNVCRFFTYEGGTHFIPFSDADQIQDDTAHEIFEQVLWPLGYRDETVDTAAAA